MFTGSYKVAVNKQVRTSIDQQPSDGTGKVPQHHLAPDNVHASVTNKQVKMANDQQQQSRDGSGQVLTLALITITGGVVAAVIVVIIIYIVQVSRKNKGNNDGREVKPVE